MEKKHIFIGISLLLICVTVISLSLFQDNKDDKRKTSREEAVGEIYPISINDVIDIYLSSFQGAPASPVSFNDLRIVNYKTDKVVDVLESDSKISFMPLDIEKLEKEKLFKEIDLSNPLSYKDDLFFYDWGEEVELESLLFEKEKDNLFIVFEYTETKNENEIDIIVPKKGYVFSLFYNEKKEVSLKKVYETKDNFHHAFIDNNNLVLLEKEENELDGTAVPSFLRPHTIKRYIYEDGKFKLTNETEVNPMQEEKQ